MTTLYIEPFGGMAGDMFLAALLDLGDERFRLADLQQLAEELVPGEARLSCERVWRGSLSGALLNVETPESEDPPHRGYADLEALLRAAPSLSRARPRIRHVMSCGVWHRPRRAFTLRRPRRSTSTRSVRSTV